MMARLPRSFFSRPAPTVAPELLGRTVVRVEENGARVAGHIVEAEAYEPDDPACHAFRGPTARNATMFGPPGRLYVYFTYGNHWMANVVTRGKGEGSAVLLRALEPIEGLNEMRRRRGREGPTELCSGPGKLCQALGIDRSFDGADLIRGRVIWLEEGRPVEPHAVVSGTRVGVSVGLDRQWRFVVADHPFVSRGRPGPPTGRPRVSTPSTR
jgi:DNA-3-methyladenine glycosylase